jgi:GMP synthase-like glutamine amidotransferase
MPVPTPKPNPMPAITYDVPDSDTQYRIELGNHNKTVFWRGAEMLFENLIGRKFHVTAGAFTGSIIDMFTKAGMKYVPEPTDADLMVFSGGADVDPAIYDEVACPETQYPSKSRDAHETAVFEYCRTNGIPMIGICRGAQLLHVLNGGKLWQHVGGHGGSSHLILDHEFNVYVDSTSIHHQMLRPNDDIRIVAATPSTITKVFKSGIGTFDKLVEHKHYLEIEAGAYDKTKCWFVQGHPEVGNLSFQGWFIKKVSDFVTKVGYSNNKEKKGA